MDARLTAEFPEYAEFANPKPLTIGVAQALLKPGEALVLFLDIPQARKLPEETLAWAVTRDEARWRSFSLGTRALSERVIALRCGLDVNAWDGEGKRRCADALGLGVETTPKQDEQLPFDLYRAYELYQALFGEFADLHQRQASAHCCIWAADTAALPGTRNREKPDPLIGYADALRHAAWLIKSNAISVLPVVAVKQGICQNR